MTFDLDDALELFPVIVDLCKKEEEQKISGEEKKQRVLDFLIEKIEEEEPERIQRIGKAIDIGVELINFFHAW